MKGNPFVTDFLRRLKSNSSKDHKGNKRVHCTHFLSVPLESWGKASKACLKLDLQGKQKYSYSASTGLSIYSFSLQILWRDAVFYPFFLSINWQNIHLRSGIHVQIEHKIVTRSSRYLEIPNVMYIIHQQEMLNWQLTEGCYILHPGLFRN